MTKPTQILQQVLAMPKAKERTWLFRDVDFSGNEVQLWLGDVMRDGYTVRREMSAFLLKLWLADQIRKQAELGDYIVRVEYDTLRVIRLFQTP